MRVGEIESIAPEASPEEAEAISIALGRFLAETSPAPERSGSPGSAWQQAALREGVEARGSIPLRSAPGSNRTQQPATQASAPRTEGVGQWR